MVPKAWFSTCIACALLALGLLSCGNSSGNAPDVATVEKEEDAIAVRTAALTRDTLSELYATTATLRADKLA
ncbi:MAG: hypothetical protein IH848_06190, partial [Acidobacteria bacterium]|nr:hypothetical protein [Acidobacteriota bacterium]